MLKRLWIALGIVCVMLSSCGGTPQLAEQSPLPQATQPAAATASLPIATEPPASAAPSALPSTAPAAATGQAVLQLAAGTAAGQVGITADGGPTTFRVAADGSLRIMDAVNKRLLFFNGSSGALQQTIDLAFLQQPTDFVVTGNGDLYVLDAGGWTIEQLAIDGARLSTIPLNADLRGRFSTISLTADGRLMGLADDQAFLLATPAGPLPAADQINAHQPGSVTVRSNASFSVATRDDHHYLSISDLAQQPLMSFDLGAPPDRVAFLDVNQGMEPYVAIDNGSNTEIRRYAVDGREIGRVVIDRAGCRAAARSLYIGRPGDVFAMCTTDSGVTITRYVMVDVHGQALPRFDQLVESVGWSPSALQAAPG